MKLFAIIVIAGSLDFPSKVLLSWNLLPLKSVKSFVIDLIDQSIGLCFHEEGMAKMLSLLILVLIKSTKFSV